MLALSICPGAYSLPDARAEGAKGHGYPGFCYVMASRVGGHYLSSTPRNHDGAKLVAKFDRRGVEAPLRRARP